MENFIFCAMVFSAMTYHWLFNVFFASVLQDRTKTIFHTVVIMINKTGEMFIIFIYFFIVVVCYFYSFSFSWIIPTMLLSTHQSATCQTKHKMRTKAKKYRPQSHYQLQLKFLMILKIQGSLKFFLDLTNRWWRKRKILIHSWGKHKNLYTNELLIKLHIMKKMKNWNCLLLIIVKTQWRYHQEKFEKKFILGKLKNQMMISKWKKKRKRKRKNIKDAWLILKVVVKQGLMF